jgi:anti-sigma factor RsiW
MWPVLAAACVLLALAIWRMAPGPPSGAIAREVASAHVRSLLADHLMDVPSSDRHTVKPWFNGRIADAPRVVDLADQGFPLVGGRVDVIGRAPVATLVYRHRQHLISLSAVPGGRTIAATPKEIGGYNLLSWSENGTAYSAVSDLAAPDLETFAKAFRAASAER